MRESWMIQMKRRAFLFGDFVEICTASIFPFKAGVSVGDSGSPDAAVIGPNNCNINARKDDACNH